MRYRAIDDSATTHHYFSFSLTPPHPRSTLFPYTTLFRSSIPGQTRQKTPQHGFRSPRKTLASGASALFLKKRQTSAQTASSEKGHWPSLKILASKGCRG